MRSMFEPALVVPGATRKFKMNEAGVPDYSRPEHDKHGRPVWNMPRPAGFAIHFKNEACKRKFRQLERQIMASVRVGDITREAAHKLLTEAHDTATHQVPFYTGVSASMARKHRADNRRRQRQQWWRQMLATAMGGATA